MEEFLKLLATKIVVGTGNVIVPPEIDRDLYIKTCLSTQTISIVPTHSPLSMNNVVISQEALQNIEFPEKDSLLGSQVIYIMLSTINTPVIIGVVSFENKSLLLGYKQFKFSKSSLGNEVSITGDGLNGNLFFRVFSDKKECGKMMFSIGNKEEKGELRVEVFGDVLYLCNNYFIKNNVTHILSKEAIYLGVENYEKAVLGNTLLDDVLKPLFSLLKKFKVITPMGPSSNPTPDTINEIVKIESNLDKILSDKVNLE